MEVHTMRDAPQIVAYHPEFLVQRGGDLFTIHVDLDDWYTDEEVLGKLAGLTGASTFGDAIQAIGKEKLASGDNSILSARISKTGTKHKVVKEAMGRSVRGWDDPIVRPVKWVGDATKIMTDKLGSDDAGA
jgi:hypothetical protein